MTPDELAEIKGLAELKRWPTMKELGQYREAMKALVAEVERLSLIESTLVQEIVRTSFHTAEQVGADVAEMMPTIALMQTAEVERLQAAVDAVRNLADWHDRKAEKVRRGPGVGTNAVWSDTAFVHDDAARRIRRALDEKLGGGE